MKRNIFIIGLNAFNKEKLEKLNRNGYYQFHNLLDESDILNAEIYDIENILDKARKELKEAPQPPDAIIGYMDFPVSTIVPILSKEFGLPATSLESLLKCEHKYWSRLEQKKVIPENIPSFQAYDPFDAEAFDKIHIPMPFWIKPIKSFASHLGFRIESREDFENAQQKIQKGINRIGDAFGKVTQMVEVPEIMKDLPPSACIAESIIEGDHQCTLEGSVFEGKAYFHGMVDSVREPGTSVFNRYEYPSALPTGLQKRMVKIAQRFLKQVGYNNAAFNIEFFWDEKLDQIWFLEINTRVAQHHSDLFEKVDGAPNQKVALDVGLGNEPLFPHQRGAFDKAAVFFHREMEDKYITSIPSSEEVKAVEKDFPGSAIQLQVHPEMWLSDLVEQDSYSYIIAIVYVGGKSTRDLVMQNKAIKKRLNIQYQASQTDQVT